MRAVLQRVTEASVSIGGQIKSSIGNGLLILLGICEEDTPEDIEWLANKIVNMRIFSDENGVMNKSVMEVCGQIMVISQFTLYASYKKGNRPSWFRAAGHEISIPLYQAFCKRMSEVAHQKVAEGEFGADMQVSLVNDGPVTICVDTKNKE
jgi:D-tyrosyl-tRNA(Tyr) deacylase